MFNFLKYFAKNKHEVSPEIANFLRWAYASRGKMNHGYLFPFPYNPSSLVRWACYDPNLIDFLYEKSYLEIRPHLNWKYTYHLSEYGFKIAKGLYEKDTTFHTQKK